MAPNDHENERYRNDNENNHDTIGNVTEEIDRPYRITMELPLFLTMVASNLTGAVMGNVLLYRTCVHALNHTVDECKPFLSPVNSTVDREIELAVQKYNTVISISKALIESLGPAVLSLFLGVWSDTHGRKPLVVWPLLGISTGSIVTLVYSMLPQFGPWWYLFSAVPFSLAGGYIAMFTGAYTYISDSSTIRNRSIRMTYIDAAVATSSVTGALLSAFLLKAIGNVAVLIVCVLLNITAFAFATTLKESLTTAVKGGLSSLFDFKLVKIMLQTNFKRRPQYGRARLLLMILTNIIAIFILYGLVTLSYVYTRQKLGWAIQQFSIYSAISTSITVVGAVVGVKLGSHVLGIGDLPLAMVALCSSIGEYIVLAFAVQPWHMYAASTIAMLKASAAPLIRSQMTKLLPPEDIAKAFSFLCVIDAICPLFSPVLYNYLYRYTLESFPGAFYMLSVALTSIGIVSLGLAHYYSKTAPLSYEIIERDAEHSNALEN